jgi:hypothetical protein
VPARVNDETVVAALRQFLPKYRKRRQIKIHRNSVDEYKSKIRSLVWWRKEQAVKPPGVGGLESTELGLNAHKRLGGFYPVSAECQGEKGGRKRWGGGGK